MPNFSAVNNFVLNGAYGLPTTIDYTTTGLGEVNADDVNLQTINGPGYLSAFTSASVVTFKQKVGWLADVTDLVVFKQVVYFRSVYTSGNAIIFKQNVRHLAEDNTIATLRQRVYSA